MFKSITILLHAQLTVASDGPGINVSYLTTQPARPLGPFLGVPEPPQYPKIGLYDFRTTRDSIGNTRKQKLYFPKLPRTNSKKFALLTN